MSSDPFLAGPPKVLRPTHIVQIPERLAPPGELVRMCEEAERYLAGRLQTQVQSPAPLVFALRMAEEAEPRLRQALLGLAEFLGIDVGAIEVTRPQPTEVMPARPSAGRLRSGELLRAIAANTRLEPLDAPLPQPKAAARNEPPSEVAGSPLDGALRALERVAGRLASVDVGGWGRSLNQMETLVSRLSEVLRSPAEDPPATQHPSQNAIVEGIEAVLAEVQARAAASEAQAAAQAERLQTLQAQVAGLSEQIAGIVRTPEEGPIALPDFSPQREGFQRLMVGFRLVLRDLGARAEEIEQITRRLDAKDASVSAAPAAELTERSLLLPDFSAEAGSFHRLLVGFRGILRRLEANTDAVGDAAREVADKAGSVPTATAEAGAAETILAKLDRLEGLLQQIPISPAQRDFAPEGESLRRLIIGFRLALRELQAGSQKVGQAAEAMEVRAAASAPDSSSAAREELAGLRAEMARLAEAVAALREARPSADSYAGPAVLESEKARLQRLLVGFTAILRRLDGVACSLEDQSSQPNAGEPLAPAAAEDVAAMREELRGLALALKTHAEHMDQLAAQSAPEPLDEDSIERVAERLGRRLRATFAEGLALAERARVSGAPPSGLEGSEATALERLAARVEKLHADLDSETGRLALALAQPHAGGLSPEAEEMASSLRTRLEEARGFAAEVLNVAAALSRDIEQKGQERAPAARSLARPRLRSGGR